MYDEVLNGATVDLQAFRMSGENQLLMGNRPGHLRATVEEASLTEFEFAAMHLIEAFRRWATQCTQVVSNYDLAYSELLVLHVVRMQDRPKDTATIANILNREDIPNVQYSLRKLVALDLIKKERSGTAFTFSVTPKGLDMTELYAELRRELLLPQLSHLDDFPRVLVEMRRVLTLLTGIYDQTARVAASYGSTYIGAGATREAEPAPAPAAKGAGDGAKKPRRKAAKR